MLFVLEAEDRGDVGSGYAVYVGAPEAEASVIRR